MVALTEQIVRGKTRTERLDEVKSLNLWGQDLDDVSILQKMTNVEVLSLSVNRISSLRDFRNCRKLQELYLRKNYIMDISDVQYLTSLTELKVLWLCDNPCADHPFYRQMVACALPSVDKLDNMEVTPQDREAAMRNPEVAKYLSIPPDDRPPTRPPLPASSTPASSPQAAPSRPYSGTSPANGHSNRSQSDAGRRKKNILYAVMALVPELDEDDLVYVKREIEQRLGSLGR